MNQATLRAGAQAAIAYTIVASPLGKILLAATPAGLRHLSFQEGTEPLAPQRDWREAPEDFRDAQEQIERYFARELRSFDLKLDLRGTPFQLKVWRALGNIPYGQTATYAQVARAIGKPAAARAVGMANAANPLPLIVPCHRVIGEGGGLTGYRGGLDLKRRLLELEGMRGA